MASPCTQPGRVPFSPGGAAIPQRALELATSHAERQFSAMGLASALLAIASAALLYRGAGSSGPLAIAAASCLLLAVVLQVIARRSLRREVVDRAVARGLDEKTAREQAPAVVSRWLRTPPKGP